MILADDAGEGSVLEADLDGVLLGVAEEARFVGEADDRDHWCLRENRAGLWICVDRQNVWEDGRRRLESGAAARLAREADSALSRLSLLPWRRRGP